MEEFSHLEGASAYSLDLDDTASQHSSAISQAPPRKNALPPTSDLDDIHDLANLQLTFDHDAHQHAPLAAHNHYEEDFEGMLDDLNRELPPHACSSVLLSTLRRCPGVDAIDSATAESTIPPAS